MKKAKKIFMLILTLVMTCAVSAIHAHAEEAYRSVSSFPEFQEAISFAPSDGTKYTIKITADIAFDGTLSIASGTNINIISDGAPWTLTQQAPLKRHFIVNGGLTLDNIILNGNNAAGGVYVNNGAITMNDGAVITKCYSGPAGSGCGIALEKSTFIMNGGEISYNRNNSRYGVSGGGINLEDSVAEMNGGKIHHNASTWGGGVEIGTGSSFTMNGGEIYSNEATAESGGGVHVYVRGTFVMNSGAIYKNTASVDSGAGGGVFVGQGSYVQGEPTDWCNFIMNGGTIEDNESFLGGGVGACFNGNFTMNNGAVRNNRAQAGGGVVVGLPNNANTRVSFIMNSGEISGNRAISNYGGGIFVYGNQLPVDVQIGSRSADTGAPPVIRGNTANSQGGAMFIYQAAATMHNGAITANKAGSLGGGICVYGKSTFMFNDGVVGGDNAGDANVASTSGGGVATSGAGNIFNMAGGKIAGNEAKDAGGGIYIGASDTASIISGNIGGNIADKNGGGIFIGSAAASVISDVTVSNNKAGNFGGGIYNASPLTSISNASIFENGAIKGGGVYAAANVSISKASITANAATNGGGTYVPAAAVLTVSDNTIFSRNQAADEGGGIYTEDYTDYGNLTSSDYRNLLTDETTIFTKNTASATYEPPASVYDYTNIKYRATSILKAGHSYLHPINNYDINFVSGAPYVLYSMTYEANGGTGGHQDPGLPDGFLYTVLSDQDTGISYADHAFTSWNTEPDGSGISYSPGETLIVNANITLYAQWEKNAVIPPENPPTGDYRNPLIRICVLFAVAIALCAVFTVRRRYI